MIGTQELINLDNIRSDVVVAKGGVLRAIIQASSVNFSLKSSDEQDAIVFEYQNFLNSLDFPLQILINSRLANLDEYIITLKEKIKTQQSQLLAIQMQEYIKFIERFLDEGNIMSTNFYVIVSFSLIETSAQKGGIKERFNTVFGGRTKLETLTPEQFEAHKQQLLQRVDFVISGLTRLGLAVKMLQTEELISLFWNAYNPDDLTRKEFLKPLFL